LKGHDIGRAAKGYNKIAALAAEVHQSEAARPFMRRVLWWKSAPYIFGASERRFFVGLNC